MDDRTERRYEALRRRINREYRQAEKELREKMEEFFAKSAERDKKKRQELADGKITMQEYQRWLRGQVFQGKRWQEKVDQMARQLTQVDETATAIVNGERLNVFADNMNYQHGEAERIIGARFDLYDQATVARLLDEQPNLLPPRRVKRSEDVPWYHKLINNCVTQGILQGESVPQIADRIGVQTGERGRTAMLRNARTAVTSAQNAGRIEAMHQQEQMGIRVQKKWIAAIDNRTRDAHRDPALAEQVINIDQPFKTMLGEILFPGDPAAHPANVYNCRCTLGYVYPDYQNTAQDAAQEDARGTEEERRAEELEERQSTQGGVHANAADRENAHSEKYTKDEKDSVEWYVSGEGQWINQYLRNPVDYGTLTNEEKSQLQLLESATEKQEITDNVLYRAVDAQAVFGEMSDLEFENLKAALIYGDTSKQALAALERANKMVGKEVKEKGFMSTTRDFEVAAGWNGYTGSAKDIVLNIVNPSGVRGFDVEEFFEVEGEEQREVLLEKGLTYRVIGIRTRETEDGGKVIVVDAEIIKKRD
jgi:uncharacterized protein with gpF-like domain